MTDDDFSGDPFADSSDPAAAEREQRRREREERRRKREAKQAEREVAAPPPPAPPSPPAEPPRTAEEELWDEPAAESPPPPPPSGGGQTRNREPGALRRHPLRVGLALAVILLGVAAIAVAAYQHFNREPPPPVVVRTFTLTIPEGYSRAQTAQLAREEGISGNYMRQSVRSPSLNPASYGGKGAKSLEGFLFPDTFELEQRASAADLIQLQLQDFKRRIKGVDMAYARSKNLTVFDVVTIASMVEEEAQLENERKLVAAVIYNRLRQGVPLGIDATVRYATGNFTQPLTESELATDSPYNTRVNAGLPPGPISSPGLASIEAAARPAKADYLYYVVEPGTCGEHAFSSTDAEFQADVARYDEARAEAGGNSPDTC